MRLSEGELDAYLMQVGHSANMVCDLPGSVERVDIYQHLRHAAIDAWWVHAALLARFIEGEPSFGEVTALDYVEGYESSESVQDITETADAHVVRYDRARLETPLMPTDPDQLRETAAALLTQLRSVADLMADPYRSTLTSYIATAGSYLP